MEAGSSVRSGCRVVRQEIIAGDEDEHEGWIGEGKGEIKNWLAFRGSLIQTFFSSLFRSFSKEPDGSCTIGSRVGGNLVAD